MNNSFLSILQKVARNNPDVGLVETGKDANGTPFVTYDEFSFSGEKTNIFNCLDSGETKVLLDGFLDSLEFNTFEIDYDLSCEIARVLATSGRVVAERALRILKQSSPSSYSSPSFIFAFLPWFSDYHRRLATALSCSLEDARDGLFVACLEVHDKTTDTLLSLAFQKWWESGWRGHGTAEDFWFDLFFQRWAVLYDKAFLFPLIKIHQSISDCL